MSLTKPLDVGFTYNQGGPSDEITKTFLNTYTTISERLKNMYVFVLDTRDQRLWLAAPLHITKHEKKTFFLFNNGYTIGFKSDDIVAVAPHAITYEAFKGNVNTIMDRVKNNKLLWMDNKNEAIIHANKVSQIINQLAIDAPEYDSHKVEISSLYDILTVIVPTLNTYLEQLEKE